MRHDLQAGKEPPSSSQLLELHDQMRETADVHVMIGDKSNPYPHNHRAMQCQSISAASHNSRLSTPVTPIQNKDDTHRKKVRSNHMTKKLLMKPHVSKLKAKKKSPLVRVIQMSPPTFVYTEPEDFMIVVQKLTGSPSSSSSSASSLSLRCTESPKSSLLDNMSAEAAGYHTTTVHMFDDLIGMRPPLQRPTAFSIEGIDADGLMLVRNDHNNGDRTADRDESAASTVSCDIASSCSHFSIADCFESLEGLPDPFEAESNNHQSASSHMDGSQPCLYAIPDHNGIAQWNLDNIFAESIDEAAQLQLFQLWASAGSYPASMQSSCVNHIDAAPAYNGEGHCHLIPTS